MPEIPGPGTPILLLDDGIVLRSATITHRINGGTVGVIDADNGVKWEAEATIVYRIIRRIEPSSQPEVEPKDQPSLGEESHVESIEPASDKPSASAESESKHQEDSPLKRKRRSARKL